MITFLLRSGKEPDADQGKSREHCLFQADVKTREIEIRSVQKHELSLKPKTDVLKYKRAGRSCNQENQNQKSKTKNFRLSDYQGLGRLVNKNKGCQRESQ